MRTTKSIPSKFGYCIVPPDFRTIMEIKVMPEQEQILHLLANCLVNDEGHKLFGGADEVNNQFRPKEIIELFQDITNLIEQEYDLSDPLSKQGSTTPTGNGFPFSASGKPL